MAILKTAETRAVNNTILVFIPSTLKAILPNSIEAIRSMTPVMNSGKAGNKA